jgi:hypothetical protein
MDKKGTGSPKTPTAAVATPTTIRRPDPVAVFASPFGHGSSLLDEVVEVDAPVYASPHARLLAQAVPIRGEDAHLTVLVMNDADSEYDLKRTLEMEESLGSLDATSLPFRSVSKTDSASMHTLSIMFQLGAEIDKKRADPTSEQCCIHVFHERNTPCFSKTVRVPRLLC